MTLNDAFEKAIKFYWKSKDHSKLKTNDKRKYDKKYFDGIESELDGPLEDTKLKKEMKGGKK